MARINERDDLVQQRVFLPIAADGEVAIGDLLWWNGTTVKRASEFTFDTSAAETRRKFKEKYCGVAIEAHRSGDPARSLPVSCIGHYQCTCQSATFDIDDLVGVYVNGSNEIQNQELIKVTDPAEAIGSTLEVKASATTDIMAQLVATAIGLGALAGAGAGSIGVLSIPHGVAPPAAGDILTDATVSDLFGGAIEVLSLSAYEVVANTADFTVNAEKNATNLTALSIPAAGGAIGRYTKVDLSADANRFFAPDDLFSLESVNAGATAGRVHFFVRYRRLS